MNGSHESNTSKSSIGMHLVVVEGTTQHTNVNRLQNERLRKMKKQLLDGENLGSGNDDLVSKSFESKSRQREIK